MTTTIRVLNEGPLPVYVWTMDSPYGGHREVSRQQILEPNMVSDPICMYGKRVVEVQELVPQTTKGA